MKQILLLEEILFVSHNRIMDVAGDLFLSEKRTREEDCEAVQGGTEDSVKTDEKIDLKDIGIVDVVGREEGSLVMELSLLEMGVHSRIDNLI